MKIFKTHFSIMNEYKEFASNLNEDDARNELKKIQNSYLSLENQGIKKHRNEFLGKIDILRERIFTLLDKKDE